MDTDTVSDTEILYVYIYVDKERGENIRWRLAELDRDKYKDDEDGDTQVAGNVN